MVRRLLSGLFFSTTGGFVTNTPTSIPPMPEKLTDFRVFLTLVWRHLNLPDPTPIQLDIALYLQHGPRRKIIEAFRGVGKSWITAAYVVWRLRQNPNLKFMVLSASKDRADNFTTFCMRLINEIPILQCLIPRPTSGARSSRSTLARPAPTMRRASRRKASSRRSRADAPMRSLRTMNNNVVLKLREFGETLPTWRQYRAKPSPEGTCNDYYVGSKRTRSAEHSFLRVKR